MRAGESRTSARTKAQRANVNRQKQMHQFAHPPAVKAPTRSWWLDVDFYAAAKVEAPRIMTATKTKDLSR